MTCTTGIEAFIRFLFQFVWCLFNAVEMEKCSSYNDNYYCFGIMVKKKNNKKQEKCVVECCTDSPRDVVFCFFFKESTNLSDGPFYSSHWQMGIKRPASHFRWLIIKIHLVITDLQNKPFARVVFFSGGLHIKIIL